MHVLTKPRETMKRLFYINDAAQASFELFKDTFTVALHLEFYKSGKAIR